MSSSQRLASVLIGLVLILGIAWQFARGQAQPDRAKAVQKWEYKQTSIATGEDGATQLSKLGEDGWELVAVYSYNQPDGFQVHRSVLKRPR
jgi:hypothetical protein